MTFYFSITYLNSSTNATTVYNYSGTTFTAAVGELSQGERHGPVRSDSRGDRASGSLAQSIEYDLLLLNYVPEFFNQRHYGIQLQRDNLHRGSWGTESGRARQGNGSLSPHRERLRVL